MAEEQIATRKDHQHDWLIWTKIFGAFRVALDPKKLLLAGAGILVMAIGWWVLACLFYNTRGVPTKDQFPAKNYVDTGIDDVKKRDAKAGEESDKAFQAAEKSYKLIKDTAGPDGTLSTFPWFEDRGPNPFQELEQAIHGKIPHIQGKQVVVLVEPLVKFLRPVIYLFHPDAGFWGRIYFFLVILWTLATWALFGAAITRMAAVQFARNEKIGMTEAVRFAWSRYVAFFSAPIFPLVLIAVLAFFLIVYGLIGVLTVFIGDIFIYGLLWPIVIIFGLIMAVVLVGLVGWPMMYSTISTEGSDSFDALSRSYSYVYQAPWHYLWYSLVAIAYGVVGVFFIGLMGSLTVYMGKWAVSQAPLASAVNREPSYLFIWAPTSYGWRDLLLSGSVAVYSHDDIKKVSSDNKPIDDPTKELDETVLEDIKDGRFKEGEVTSKYKKSFSIWNWIGTFLVSFWIYLVFLLVVGFGYSYFWSASAIIYLLMRRKVDDTEIDEVHLEEEEMEESYTPPAPPSPAGKPEGTPGLIPPESLTLRVPPGDSPSIPKTEESHPAPAAEPPPPNPAETPPPAPPSEPSGPT